jgi:hypothetical protein
MRVILDTGILFRADILRQLAEQEGEIVLSAVAYAE